MNIKPYILPLMNLWPPFLFAGIKIVKISKDYRLFIVQLKLRFWNSNDVGTQYGGSMFSMSDPFYMMMLMKNLGPSYVVWDKSATIRYLKPGRSDLTTVFQITEEDLNNIRTTLQTQDKMEWNRKIEIKDADGVIVAEVDKVLSIKNKKEQKSEATYFPS